jgi:hypothetical protein
VSVRISLVTVTADHEISVSCGGHLRIVLAAVREPNDVVGALGEVSSGRSRSLDWVIYVEISRARRDLRQLWGRHAEDTDATRSSVEDACGLDAYFRPERSVTIVEVRASPTHLEILKKLTRTVGTVVEVVIPEGVGVGRNCLEERSCERAPGRGW